MLPWNTTLSTFNQNDHTQQINHSQYRLPFTLKYLFLHTKDKLKKLKSLVESYKQ